MAGRTCYRLGERFPLIHLVREYRGRTNEPKGFGWRGLRDLLVRASIQLGAPIVSAWDNIRLHLTKPLRECRDPNATGPLSSPAVPVRRASSVV
ncbi:hypothetical protein [Streptomyces sp. NPDC059466]|uniref:hypothetical protein n=1 Tax=unclassified Streptomyces TaxID=2593676 RepID=UPI0036C4BCFB